MIRKVLELSPLVYMFLLILSAFFVFNGLHVYVESFGFHIMLENISDDMFSAWYGHPKEQNYTVTYAWMVFSSFFSIPIYLFLIYISMKISGEKKYSQNKFTPDEAKVCIFFCVIFYFISVLYLGTDFIKLRFLNTTGMFGLTIWNFGFQTYAFVVAICLSVILIDNKKDSNSIE